MVNVDRSSASSRTWILTLNDGLLKTATSHVVDNGSAGVSPDVFEQGLLAMPQKYLRMMVARWTEEAPSDAGSSEETAAGDRGEVVSLTFATRINVQDRHVLILKDVFHSGVTENYLITHLSQQRPASMAHRCRAHGDRDTGRAS